MQPLLQITALTMLASAATGFAAEPAVMRALFNGKDLSGWSGEGYVVEDGSIVCTAQGKNLMTEQTFSNYVLDFEFKLPAGGNNGLGIHYPGSGDGAYVGMELQILDNSDPKYNDLLPEQFHGSLYKLAAAKKTGLKPVGEWNHERVSVSGFAVSVELNGENILSANLDELSASHPQHEGVKRRAGHIAWLGHGDPVAFKNIQIAETPPLANTAGVQAAGFTPLFNGTDLKGWKQAQTPQASAVNGILKLSGNGKPSQLSTDKEYANCTLVFDWRGSEAASGKQTSAELDRGISLRGSSTCQVKFPSSPSDSATAAARPIGEWNRTMITIQGELLTVSLNGRLVLDKVQLAGVAAKGAIGLQPGSSALEFANFWIKALE